MSRRTSACRSTRRGVGRPWSPSTFGLPENGPRACDREARRVLGPGQGGRVFPAPSRAALAGSTYEECGSLNRVACGVALARQGYAILGKIREVDELMSPERQESFREVRHPARAIGFSSPRLGSATRRSGAYRDGTCTVGDEQREADDALPLRHDTPRARV